MRGGMTVDLQRLRILRSQDLELGVGFKRTGKIVELAIDARYHGIVGQPRTDGFGDIQGTGTGWDALLAAVGQSDRKALAHVNLRVSSFRFLDSGWAC